MKSFDIINFLGKFYGITNESLNNDTISHSDMKKLFPFIRTCQFDMENFLKGNIISVYDKTGNIVYYESPHLIINDIDIKESVNNEEIIDIKKIDLSILSKEELLKLRRKLRLLGLVKESKKLTKLIHKKKQEEPKEYREKREKLKIKESYYD